MKGLELAEKYWTSICEPVIEEIVPEALPHLAAGLVGEGSECLGYDDEISRDHDWGPGFCIWLDNEDSSKYGGILNKIYSALPEEYLGYKRLRTNELSAGRIGVINSNLFYNKYLGRASLPSTLMDWMDIKEDGLCTATNGKVFYDGKGEFTRVRKHLLRYYPEDVRLKKLAGYCAKAAQSGQYNYSRSLKRGDNVVGLIALSEFIENVQAVYFLINKRYRPYYKWVNRMMKDLGNEESSVALDLEQLTKGDIARKSQQIESICVKIKDTLRRRHLSSSGSDFLLDHGLEIQNSISNSDIRSLPLMRV